MKLNIRAVAVAAVLAFGCAPALSACNTISALTGHTISHADSTKAMIDAEAAFNAGAAAEQQAKVAGVLTGANAAKGDALVAQAYSALLVARATYAAGNAPSTAQLVAIVTQITTLVQGAKQ